MSESSSINRAGDSGSPRKSGASALRKTPWKPSDGWWALAGRVKEQLKSDHVPIVSAGVAFYFFLALFPAIAAMISIYGMVVDPGQAEAQVAQLAAILPKEAHQLISDFAGNLTRQPDKELGWGGAFSILLSFWSMNKGAKAIVKGVNIAFDVPQERGFFHKTAVTLAFSLGTIVLVTIALTLVVGVPVALKMAGLTGGSKVLVSLVRWPLIAALLMFALTCIYKFGPNRHDTKFQWVTWGSVIATLLWLGGSGLFSLYVDNLGTYGKSYGSMAAVVILMLWFFLSAFIILLGAEINSELAREVNGTAPPDGADAEDSSSDEPESAARPKAGEERKEPRLRGEPEPDPASASRAPPHDSKAGSRSR